MPGPSYTTAPRDLVRDYVTEHLADDNAVLVIDETGFLKQGKASTSQPLQRLHQLESGTTTETALAFFDSLPPLEVAIMIGSWRGKTPEGRPDTLSSPIYHAAFDCAVDVK